MAIYGFVASGCQCGCAGAAGLFVDVCEAGTIAAAGGWRVYRASGHQVPALTQYVHAAGRFIKGTLFPFLFVTIAFGAISGFHSAVSSGRRRDADKRKAHARFIWYGAMVAESWWRCFADRGLLSVSGIISD